MLLMFFIQLYDNFRVFLLRTLYKALPGVKCFFTRPMNFCPRLVFTLLLYGGLYHVIFLFLRAGCGLVWAGSGSLYWSMCLYPLAVRASWYVGLALLNSASDDTMAISLLLIEIGICFNTLGGGSTLHGRRWGGH